MKDTIKIQKPSEHDYNHIKKIIKSAFVQNPYSNQKEHLLVEALRKRELIDISLVAKKNDDVVGHIAFTKITVNGIFSGWYGLAPVSVVPEHQNKGIGSELILNGLSELKKINAKGCVLVGEPEYYKRFGFINQKNLKYEGVPNEYFLVHAFDEVIPEGLVQYHELFDKFG